MKPTSKSALAGMYDIHRNTLARWCKALNIETQGRILSIKQLGQIFEHYGPPGNYEEQLMLNL